YAEDPAGGLDAAIAEAPVPLCALHERLVRAVLQVLALADEQGVAARPDRLDGRLLDRVARGDRGHLEVVREEHALEADLRAEEARAAPPRERRRAARIERLAHHVRCHHRRDPRARRGAERRELDLLEPR